MVIQLVKDGTPLPTAARMAQFILGLSVPIRVPPRRQYERWKNDTRQRLTQDRLIHEKELRKALKDPNLLDLERLSPVPLAVLAKGSDAARNWRIKHWGTKWNTVDANVGRLKRLGPRWVGLTYSFLTAWAEPFGAIAAVSRVHPTLCFILAGVEVDTASFTSHFIHRGHARSWQMLERIWKKHAEYETEDDGNEYLAGYQPRIMQTLIERWESVAKATLHSRPKSPSRRPRWPRST